MRRGVCVCGADVDILSGTTVAAHFAKNTRDWCSQNELVSSGKQVIEGPSIPDRASQQPAMAARKVQCTCGEMVTQYPDGRLAFHMYLIERDGEPVLRACKEGRRPNTIKKKTIA